MRTRTSELTTRSTRDLTALFDPRSVAVVGASNDPAKYGNWLAIRALAGCRPTYLVNSRSTHVLGEPAYSSLVDVVEPVDLAIIAVPASAFEAAVDDALAAGVRAIVGITASLGESGAEGLRLQQSLAQRVYAAGAVMLGPNCLGVLDHTTDLDATVNNFVPGSIALLSQSGNVALDLAQQLAVYGLGISRFASLGNQADLDTADLIEACVEHEGSTAIAVYSEGINDGRRFAAAAARAEAAGKPVVLLAAGRSQASARGAASHTGSMVTSHTVIQAACDAVGAEFVSSPREAAALLQALVKGGTMRTGSRIAVFADGGGHASLASDALEEAGLRVEPFASATHERIMELLPDSGGTVNPIDTAGAGERDPSVFVRVIDALIDSPDVDATLLTGYLGGYGEYSADLAASEVAAARELAASTLRGGQRVIAQLMFDTSLAAQALRDGGVPVYRHVEDAAWVLRRIVDRGARQPIGVPVLPPPADPVENGDYWSARLTLRQVGVPFVPAARVVSEDQLYEAARTLSYPLVLKALGDEHKSDRGGVVLAIRSEQELRTAWHNVQERLAPPAVSLEEMADLSEAVELIIGIRRDRAFGPVVLVGAGGVLTELLHDTQCALGPLSPPEALRLINRLRAAPLLHGYRGRPSVNLAAAANVIADLSQFAAAHPEIAEIECNPVAVTPLEAIALDARIILGQQP